MLEALIQFVTGAFMGGLTLSACWGLWWLIVGMIGFSRGTCGWRVLFNSLTVSAISLLLAWALYWLGVASLPNALFAAGLSVVPVALMALAFRPAPDGRRAGAYMLEGVRHLMDELLGKHHECRDCAHDHEARSLEGRR